MTLTILNMAALNHCNPSNAHELQHETSLYTTSAMAELDADIDDPTNCSAFRYEHAPLFAHESFSPPNHDEARYPPSLTSSEASLSSTSLHSTAPFPAFEEGVTPEDVELNPEVEVFPCERAQIFKQIGTTQSRLDADSCASDAHYGSPPAQVIPKNQLRDRTRSKHRSSSSLLSERVASLDAISEEGAKMLPLSRPKYGSCLSQCQSFQGISEEPDETETDSDESPVSMKPTIKSRKSANSTPVTALHSPAPPLDSQSGLPQLISQCTL